MRFGHLKKFLAEQFIAKGVESEKAPGLAEFFIVLLKNAGVTTEKRIESWEADAQVYTLRTHGVGSKTIMESHGLGRSVIYAGIKRHLERRRLVERAKEAQGINRDGSVQVPLFEEV